MITQLSALVAAIGMAIAAGLVGCFAVMRRMTLASDAMAHIALPGIGIALLLHMQPFVGAIAMLLLGSLLVWFVETRSQVPIEAVIGVVFSAALAVGEMFTPGDSLIEALFGSPGTLAPTEVALGIGGTALVVFFILGRQDSLVIALVSPELARTSGIDVSRLSLAFLLVFALTVALGLRFLGVLLMGSLIIIPATTAKHVARDLHQMMAVSATVAVVSTLLGSYVAHTIHRESGPIIIVTAAAIFFLSLFARRQDEPRPRNHKELPR